MGDPVSAFSDRAEGHLTTDAPVKLGPPPSAVLEAAHDEAIRVLDHLKPPHALATNVKKNRVEVYVKNKARFEAVLGEAGVRLPEHVVVVESELCCLAPS